MSLKIVYIHTTDIAANDTSSTFVVNNALSIAEQGVEIKLVVTNSSSKDGSSIICEKYNLPNLPKKLEVIDFKKRTRTNLWFYIFCLRLFIQLNRDVITITRTHGLLPYIVPVARGKMVFFETHDFFYDLSIRDDINKSRRKKKSRIEKKFFPRLNGLICLNKHQKELYEKYLTIPINVFPTGLKQVFIHEKVDSRDIVYVGSLNRRLGIQRIVDLSLKLQNYNFIIVGGKTDNDIKEFHELFPENTLPENVKITGWIGKKELGALLQKAIIGLLPLTDTFFNRYLTVPLKLFDYLAYGLITIAPDYPSCSEFVIDGRTGFLVNWDNQDEVSERIESIIGDEEKKSIMASEIFDAAKSMTWERRAKDQILYLQNYV